MAEKEDTLWCLRQAAQFSGFTPNAESVAEFAKSLERRGWLRRAERGPYWVITPAGHIELARLEDEARATASQASKP